MDILNKIQGKNLIGHRVRETRHKSKSRATQMELLSHLQVKGLDLEKTTISKIESKNRSVTDIELIAIADSLNVPVTWLLGIQ